MAIAAKWVCDRDKSTRVTPSSRAASLPCSALYTASFAASRTATWVAVSGRLSQYARSAGVRRRSNTRPPLSLMIAAMRATSTRSTPTPIALTPASPEALKAQAHREPDGGGQVAAQYQPQPDERDRAGPPNDEHGPQGRPPALQALELGGPAALFFRGLGLQSQPRRLETARDGAQRFLPIRVDALVEHAGVARAGGGGVEGVERGDELLAPLPRCGEARRDGTLLPSRQQPPPPAAARHADAARGALDPAVERVRNALGHAAHG